MRRIAVITASASGIGLATAQRLVDDGWHVVMSDLDDERGEVAAAELGAIYAHCDLRDATAIEALFAEVGPIGLLVNNGGISGPTAPVVNVSLDDWEETLAVNLTAQFVCCRAVLPGMIAAGRGAIVNVSSVAGRIGYPNRAPYAVSKWGVLGLTAALAQEVGPVGIRVNAVLPAAVRGGRIEQVIRDFAAANAMSIEEAESDYLGRHALPQLIEPEDVADMIAYLGSDRARSITGQFVAVDCGYQ